MYEHDFIFKTVYDLNSEEIKYDKWVFNKNRKPTEQGSVGFSFSLFILHNEGLRMNISPSFQ